MLTEPEQRAWADGLGHSPRERVAVLAALLRYAKEDGMTAEDRTICVRQIKRLAEEARLNVDGVLHLAFKGKHRGNRRKIA